MQMFEELVEVCRVGKTARNDVVVIGKDGPRFELPMILAGEFHEPALQQIQPCFILEQVLLVQCAGGHEINGVVIELVNRRVRPRHFGLR